MQLNLLPSGVMPVLYLNQYDYGTLKTFEVYNGAELFAIPTGYSVTLRATKPDGYGITVAGSYTAGQHIVFVTIPQQLTAAAGDVIAELVFANANSVRVGTINFVIRIEPAALSDSTIISDSDIAYAEEVLDQLQSVQALGNNVAQNTAAIASEASTRAAAVASLQAADTALSSSLAAETSARQAGDTALSNQIAALQGAVGAPQVAATAAAMTDTSKIYVYTGSETGYTAGNWYYYNGSSWVSGGVYNAVAVNTDPTLSVAGMAADAKATGDQVTDLKSQISDIVDYKNHLDWVRGTWNSGVLLTGSAYNKRRATSQKFTAVHDLVVSVSDYATYRFEISYFDSSETFTGVSYWCYSDRQINAGTTFAITLAYVDENAHSVVDEVKNDLWNALSISDGINYASTRRTLAETTEKTKNLLSVVNSGKSTQAILLLDLGADMTFADGVVFSCTLKNAAINSASNAFVDLQKADGTHQYCLYNKMVDASGNLLGAGTYSGRYYSTYDIYPRGVTFRYVYLRYNSTAVPSGEITDFMLTSGQNRCGAFVGNRSGVDYVAREKLADTAYYYDGEPLDFRRKGYNVSPIGQIPAIPSGAETRQGFAVHGGVIFQLYNPDKVTLVDMATRASIATLSITSEHGDTADFSDEYYNGTDEFPLMFVSADTNPAKVYVNRVTRSATTLVRTYSFPDITKTGYYAGHSLDAENDILYMVGYSQASYTDDMSGTNRIMVSRWNLNNTVQNENETLTPEYLDSFTVPFISTIQGQAFLNGRIFLLSSNGSSPYDSKIIAVDVFKKQIVSRFENLPSGMESTECEGLGFVYDSTGHRYDLIASGNLYYKLTFN